MNFTLTKTQLSSDLQKKLALVTRNPVIDNLLHSLSGFLAILDDQRRVMTVNDSLLAFLGDNNFENLLGRRLGEALACIHAQETPGGCGSSRFCSSCGVAKAIVSCLELDKPVETISASKIEIGGRESEICFQVRASPIIFEKQKFVILLLQDISRQHSQAALERVFFHDISNILTGLLGATQNLAKNQNNQKLLDIILRAGLRLKSEVDIQKTLSRTKAPDYQSSLDNIGINQIISELEEIIKHHAAAAGKSLILGELVPDRKLRTDSSLLLRILLNMLTNAFEATAPGGHVKLLLEDGEKGTTFMVWNEVEIPPEFHPRIFQRHFSTKEGQGRGLGTYSMKLFGEKILKGKVDFTSSREAGTTFRLALNEVSGPPS